MTEYTTIRIYTNEKARYEGKNLASSIVSYVRSLRFAARCVVLRGIEGAYEDGEAVNGTTIEVAYHMPLVIDVVLPAAESGPVIAVLETMVTDGLVTVSTATVTSFRGPSSLIPPHLLVRDIMTANPIAAHADFTVRIAMELLIDHSLKSLPIIDTHKEVIGILTQGDLVRKAAMPVRIGLLSSLSEIERERWLRSTEEIRVPEIMTGAPQTIREDAKVTSAVHLMAKRGLKRLPVVDAQGKLTGMLSRIDVLKALARGSSVGSLGPVESTQSPHGRLVKEFEERDSLSLLSTTPIRDAIDILAKDSSQRAAVVDADGFLLGLVTDKLLLESIDKSTLRLPFFRALRSSRRAAETVAGIMLRDIKTIMEDDTIDEALRLMTEQGLKRVPVVDGLGKFQGMLRRDTVLLALTGYL